jgi:hypothetical protein
VVTGEDPVDVTRRQLATDSGEAPERISASLVATEQEEGRSWARVHVEDTSDPPGYETVEVLLVSPGDGGEWRVLVYGGTVGEVPEDLVSYGMGLDTARLLFPE